MSVPNTNHALGSLAVPLRSFVVLAGFVCFIASFLPWYTFTDSSSSGYPLLDIAFIGWHGFAGSSAVVLALVGSGLAIFVTRQRRFATAGFALVIALIYLAAFAAVIAAFFIRPSVDYSYLPVGHGWGHWVALVSIVIGLGAAVAEVVAGRRVSSLDSQSLPSRPSPY